MQAQALDEQKLQPQSLPHQQLQQYKKIIKQLAEKYSGLLGWMQGHGIRLRAPEDLTKILMREYQCKEVEVSLAEDYRKYTVSIALYEVDLRVYVLSLPAGTSLLSGATSHTFSEDYVILRTDATLIHADLHKAALTKIFRVLYYYNDLKKPQHQKTDLSLDGGRLIYEMKKNAHLCKLSQGFDVAFDCAREFVFFPSVRGYAGSVVRTAEQTAGIARMSFQQKQQVHKLNIQTIGDSLLRENSAVFTFNLTMVDVANLGVLQMIGMMWVCDGPYEVQSQQDTQKPCFASDYYLYLNHLHQSPFCNNINYADSFYCLLNPYTTILSAQKIETQLWLLNNYCTFVALQYSKLRGYEFLGILGHLHRFYAQGEVNAIEQMLQDRKYEDILASNKTLTICLLSTLKKQVNFKKYEELFNKMLQACKLAPKSSHDWKKIQPDQPSNERCKMAQKLDDKKVSNKTPNKQRTKHSDMQRLSDCSPYKSSRLSKQWSGSAKSKGRAFEIILNQIEENNSNVEQQQGHSELPLNPCNASLHDGSIAFYEQFQSARVRNSRRVCDEPSFVLGREFEHLVPSSASYSPNSLPISNQLFSKWNRIQIDHTLLLVQTSKNAFVDRNCVSADWRMIAEIKQVIRYALQAESPADMPRRFVGKDLGAIYELVMFMLMGSPEYVGQIVKFCWPILNPQPMGLAEYHQFIHSEIARPQISKFVLRLQSTLFDSMLTSTFESAAESEWSRVCDPAYFAKDALYYLNPLHFEPSEQVGKLNRLLFERGRMGLRNQKGNLRYIGENEYMEELANSWQCLSNLVLLYLRYGVHDQESVLGFYEQLVDRKNRLDRLAEKYLLKVQGLAKNRQPMQFPLLLVYTSKLVAENMICLLALQTDSKNPLGYLPFFVDRAKRVHEQNLVCGPYLACYIMKCPDPEIRVLLHLLASMLRMFCFYYMGIYAFYFLTFEGYYEAMNKNLLSEVVAVESNLKRSIFHPIDANYKQKANFRMTLVQAKYLLNYFLQTIIRSKQDKDRVFDQLCHVALNLVVLDSSFPAWASKSTTFSLLVARSRNVSRQFQRAIQLMGVPAVYIKWYNFQFAPTEASSRKLELFEQVLQSLKQLVADQKLQSRHLQILNITGWMNTMMARDPRYLQYRQQVQQIALHQLKQAFKSTKLDIFLWTLVHDLIRKGMLPFQMWEVIFDYCERIMDEASREIFEADACAVKNRLNQAMLAEAGLNKIKQAKEASFKVKQHMILEFLMLRGDNAGFCDEHVELILRLQMLSEIVMQSVEELAKHFSKFPEHLERFKKYAKLVHDFMTRTGLESCLNESYMLVAICQNHKVTLGAEFERMGRAICPAQLKFDKSRIALSHRSIKLMEEFHECIGRKIRVQDEDWVDIFEEIYSTCLTNQEAFFYGKYLSCLLPSYAQKLVTGELAARPSLAIVGFDYLKVTKTSPDNCHTHMTLAQQISRLVYDKRFSLPIVRMRYMMSNLHLVTGTTHTITHPSRQLYHYKRQRKIEQVTLSKSQAEINIYHKMHRAYERIGDPANRNRRKMYKAACSQCTGTRDCEEEIRPRRVLSYLLHKVRMRSHNLLQIRPT